MAELPHPRKRRRQATPACPAAAPRLREAARVPVHVVEDHDEVLPPIHRAIASRHLPVRGTAIVHFDSHPDLLSPDLPAAQIRDPQAVYRATSIGSFILPLVFAGHVGTVVWVKQAWCRQIECGHHTIEVGEDTATGLIRVDSTLPYFLNEGLFAEELAKRQRLDLHVVDSSSPGLSAVLEQVQAPFLLDICLDFFSCQNPFRLAGGSAGRARFVGVLHAFYSHFVIRGGGREDRLAARLQRHRARFLAAMPGLLLRLEGLTPAALLDSLSSALRDDPEGAGIGDLAGSRGSGCLGFQYALDSRQDASCPVTASAARLVAAFQGLTAAERVPEEDMPWPLVGQMCDLPHRHLEQEELGAVVHEFQAALVALGSRRPAMVTIARSAVDQFTPRSQVDAIQRELLDTVLPACFPIHPASGVSAASDTR